MIVKEKDGVIWLEFEIFQDFPQIVHGVFLRKGGASQGEFASLNVGRNVKDSIEAVTENRKKVQRCLALEKLVFGNQTHQDLFVDVSQYNSDTTLVSSCDGLITSLTQIGLSISHADCQAVIFFDPKKNVIANVHCGWRGNVQNILGKMVRTLKEQRGCDPLDIVVGISPSLGPFYSEFINYQQEFPMSFYSYQIKPCFFDLWKISQDQLMQEGVLSKHIECANLCTYMHSDLFFSYRRDHVTGRHAIIIALKDLLNPCLL
ncbi:MAG: peptidoglycan editing factor PgeF [Chlamydiota bacterium]